MSTAQIENTSADPTHISARLAISWFVALAVLLTVAFALGSHSKVGRWLIAMEHGDVSVR